LLEIADPVSRPQAAVAQLAESEIASCRQDCDKRGPEMNAGTAATGNPTRNAPAARSVAGIRAAIDFQLQNSPIC
jgi:hypothetical protein